VRSERYAGSVATVAALGTWTAGLAGDRDPAQPLLTLLKGPARVELSGATTANWVAKSANLIVDSLGSPPQVGLLLPLHWQGIVLLLAGVATGAHVVVAPDVDGLAGCAAVFTTVEQTGAALDAGADDVLAVSLHPLGAPLPAVPPMVLDHGREVPGHGDHWGGAAPADVRISVGGGPLGPLPELGLGDRPGAGDGCAVRPADAPAAARRPRRRCRTAARARPELGRPGRVGHRRAGDGERGPGRARPAAADRLAHD